MAAIERVDATGRTRVRVDLAGSGKAAVSTGLPVLDHLLGLLAAYARFDLALEVAPGAALEEAAASGRALGDALAEAFAAPEAPRYGSAQLPADEALALVVLEASGRPLVLSNVDFSSARVGGLGADVVASFVSELAEGAGLTLHLRLLEGDETQHVLDAIFKALGVALARASGRQREE